MSAGVLVGCFLLLKIPLLLEMGLVISVCMSVHYEYTCPQKSKEGTGSPENVVKDACELPCRCCESNPGPLEEQPALSTAEPSLQPL